MELKRKEITYSVTIPQHKIWEAQLQEKFHGKEKVAKEFCKSVSLQYEKSIEGNIKYCEGIINGKS